MERICLTDEQVIGYLDKDLPAEELEKVELHLIQCADCLYDIAVIEKNLDLFEKGQLPDIPADSLTNLTNFIKHLTNKVP